jgi:hypothetical protein
MTVGLVHKENVHPYFRQVMWWLLVNGYFLSKTLSQALHVLNMTTYLISCIQVSRKQGKSSKILYITPTILAIPLFIGIPLSHVKTQM